MTSAKDSMIDDHSELLLRRSADPIYMHNLHPIFRAMLFVRIVGILFSDIVGRASMDLCFLLGAVWLWRQLP
jgi:hypothetical protein